MVTLHMSSPCARDSRPAFTCLILGNELNWNVNGYELSFSVLSPVGDDRRRNGFEATLVGISDFNGQMLRTSILTISDTFSQGELSIECNNAQTSKSIKYLLAGT